MQAGGTSSVRRRPPSQEGAGLRRVVVLLAALAATLAACADNSESSEASPEFTGDPALEVYQDREHLVGEVNGELFIAFAMSPSGGPGEPGEFTGYLCDGEDIGAWFTGELTHGEEATFEAGDDIRIDLTFDGDVVSGTVAIADGEPEEFAAEPATGRAGLTRLEARTDDDRTAVSGWITLNDGRQQGILCFPGSLFWPACLGHL